MSHLPIQPDPAQAARDRVAGVSPSNTAHAVRPSPHAPGDDVFREIIHALKTGPLRGFDMGSAAMVGAAGVEGRVWLRADGRTHTLTTLDASLLALLVRIEAFRASDVIADALVRASCEAERRVAAIHAWSGQVRPTEDGE